MMTDGKHNPEETDPEKIALLLEVELMQKRAAWQQTKARRSSLRSLSFLFLFLIIVGALVGFFVFLSPRLQEARTSATSAPSPSPTATAGR
jgi:hypothetical protein